MRDSALEHVRYETKELLVALFLACSGSQSANEATPMREAWSQRVPEVFESVVHLVPETQLHCHPCVNFHIEDTIN